MRKVILVIVVVLLLGGLGAGGYWWHSHRGGAQGMAFKTAPVTQGDIVAAISATGTVEPEEVVDVGAQVAGRILAFGTDADGAQVDYGSVVAEKMVLARIDDTMYTADRDSAQASVAQAEANVVQAEANVVQTEATVTRDQADLEQMKAKRTQAENDWNRAQTLWKTNSGALAKSAYDQYLANFEVAKSNVNIDEANIKLANAAVRQANAGVVQAKAAVSQAQATLKKCQQNLDYCTIKSPVNGTIIARRVNSGQTVVASLSAPSLFLIAKDLKKIQVWVSVNEADIAHITKGQTVKFTVDALPGRVFNGKVGKVRLNATMTQNVVTYTVEVVTDNLKGELLPYLTANASFETGRSEDVLMVPNAALRWRPAAGQVAPQAPNAETEKPAAAADKPAADSGEKAPSERAASKSGGTRRGGAKVYVVDGAYARAVPVKAGLSDGINTEVSGEGLKEGMEVIVGEVAQGAAQAPGGGGSPFTPQMPSRSRGGATKAN